MFRLPPLETLRVFEVAGRVGSYSRAAAELGVTHGAVSQRIAQLETHLNVQLFQRRGNRMALTPSGVRLHATVSQALSQLVTSMRGLSSAAADSEINVSLLPVMASRWLVPRLPRFNAIYPRIFVNVTGNRTLANFKTDGIDLAVRLGNGHWKGARSRKLFDEDVFPVCSPMFNGGKLPKKPSDFPGLPLLLDRNIPWSLWFRAAGVKVDRHLLGTSFIDANLLMDAACAGQGIALIRASVAAPDLNSGRLVQLSSLRYKLPLSHYVVYPPSAEADDSVMAFRDWLLEEAQLG
ncbi:LysR substrate-binding domain-containing protein [Tardiphaga sp. 839_C3_N1_4]|uniref:LysR substrate-binding domain-containing protein n=1 Tax=Tardiphaga sp. 839_C3_N1_4 TaxID=3240761 RepID=UPI003F235B26